MFLGDYFLTITFTYKYFPLSVRQMRVLQWDRYLALLFLKGIHPQGCDAEIKCSLPFQAFTFRHSLCPYSTLWRLPLRQWYIFSAVLLRQSLQSRVGHLFCTNIMSQP